MRGALHWVAIAQNMLRQPKIIKGMLETCDTTLRVILMNRVKVV